MCQIFIHSSTDFIFNKIVPLIDTSFTYADEALDFSKAEADIANSDVLTDEQKNHFLKIVETFKNYDKVQLYTTFIFTNRQ